MAITPQIRCSRLAEAFAFYTKMLDFEYVDDSSTDGGIRDRGI